jgi:hypothetical protein
VPGKAETRIGGEVVVAGVDAAEVLEAAEGILDEVSASVGGLRACRRTPEPVMVITKCLISVPPVNRFTVAARAMSQCDSIQRLDGRSWR